MNKLYKKISIFLIILTLLFTGGCGIMNDNTTDVTEEVEELETELNDDLDTMENEAIEDVDKNDTVDREKINEAVTYIHENINEPFKSEDITKKLYYYASYIMAAADKKGFDIDDDIYTLASDTKQYISNIYREENDKDDDIMVELKTSIDDIANRLDDTKDELVDKFYNLIK